VINLNPSPPTIRGLIKLHKTGHPIRPIVNWKNAPAYKLAQLLIKKLNTYIPLPYVYNVRNSTHLINDLNNIPVTPDLKLVSFDICNTYPNIPTKELPHILSIMCKQQNVPPPLQQQILSISELILKQNYFKHQNTTHLQNEGLAMGAPTSSIFS
jgi:hypothetical protein